MRNPTIVLASDSFKGCASSSEVNDLLERGVSRVLPESRILKFPLADGGEGTVEALVTALDGTYREITVHGPLGTPVQARYGLLEDDTAIIEVAQACGISLISQTPENALAASSFGVGELVRDALGQGARHIWLGLGGSATSDGGTGMARALGFRLLDSADREVAPGLAGLRDVAHIDCAHAAPELRQADFTALADVKSPLAGPTGAVAVFGPQKGIPRERVPELDRWMRSYGELLERTFGRCIASMPGSGAAGGLGAGVIAYCDGYIESGVERVLDAMGIDKVLNGADLVITGEGHLDAQSARGKAPVGIARRARAHGVPTYAVVGSCDDSLDTVHEAGISLVAPSSPEWMSTEESMREAKHLIPDAAEKAARAWLERTGLGTGEGDAEKAGL